MTRASDRLTSALRSMWAPVVVAAVLRGLQALLRWDEVAWMYAAYPGPTVDALEAGDWAGALRFVGLHPPLFPLLHAQSERWLPVPALWLGTSALASTLAVAALAWRWPVAAWVLATSPLQVHHAAEVNNYPLLALWVSAAWVAREHAAQGRWGWLAGVGALAAWTHGLAGWAVGAVALTLGARGAWRPLGVMALASLPLVPEVLALAAEEGTWKQPPIRLGWILDDWSQRFGLLGLGLVPLALAGARRHPAAAAVWWVTAGFIGVLLVLGVAAPHQSPYWLALGAPFALLVQAGIGSARGWGWALAVVLAQGGWQAAYGGMRLEALLREGPRGIDVALAESAPGDAIVLLAPPGVNDDDKRASSAVLWRLRPWWPMPMARPYPFAYDDFRHGQPRTVKGRVVYVQDTPREELDLALGAHRHLWLVVYEHKDNPRYTTELEQRFGLTAQVVGPDRVLRLQGPSE